MVEEYNLGRYRKFLKNWFINYSSNPKMAIFSDF